MTTNEYTGTNTYNKHLTLEQRITIASLIESNRNLDGSLKIKLKDIGKILGKDPTSVSKEVKRNVELFVFKKKDYKYTNKYCNVCNKKDSCSKKAILGNTKGQCDDFKDRFCPHTIKFPYCCNGCCKRGFCSYPQRYYVPSKAQDIYTYKLKESRTGIMLNDSELESLNTIVSDGLAKGQSLNHIICSNDLVVSEKTLYNYLHKGLFDANKLQTHRMMRLRPRKRNITRNSKIMKKAKEGRQYEDYQKYIAQHPEETLTQWDTVEGKKGGKVLLSIIIVKIQFHFYFLLPDKTAKSVVNKLNEIEDKIGLDNFRALFGFSLTDNGSEFTDIDGMIANENGEIRTNLFFCHPNSSGEKGSCEKDHEILRYILPKGTSFNHLTDDDVNLIMSHTNSYKRKSIGSSSPIELFYAMFGVDILDKLGVSIINPRDVHLKPTLIK